MLQKKPARETPALNLGAPRGYRVAPQPNTRLILERLQKGKLPEAERKALTREYLYSDEGKRLLARIAIEKATRGPAAITEREARGRIRKQGHL